MISVSGVVLLQLLMAHLAGILFHFQRAGYRSHETRVLAFLNINANGLSGKPGIKTFPK
jgi:hypothetical protein